MNKWIKRSAIGIGALVAAAGLAVAGGLYLAERKMTRAVHVAVTPVQLDSSTATLEHGRYLFKARGCAHCHGDNGGGHEVFNGDGMRVVAPNITTGQNGVVADYTSEDWVRVLRHGLKPGGQPVLIMPSEDWARMSNQDAGALISYAQQLPPVSGDSAVIELPLPVRLLYAAGMIEDAAAKIDHSLPPPAPVAATVSLEHGKYLANMCMGCHGAGLSGGKIPGAPPAWPAAPNLTPGPGSVLPRYETVEAFRTMMRSGRRPDGSPVDSAMPFDVLRSMNDTDLDAMFYYFKSMAPVKDGQR
ncbi:c-type cytochrome [Massilia niastensis]|uniref:c-type cytochrome n=1 Tax=Massilia niastensis TaxID=544911 RepID=UPI00037A21B4|nr:c-type cytochrome [Massilia niastensis]